VVTNPATGAEVCRTVSKADGSFTCRPASPLPDGTKVQAVATDPQGRDSDPGKRTVHVPRVPVLDPSDGSEIKGKADPGDTVTIVNPDTGEELCQVMVGSDGRFGCTIDPKLPSGSPIEAEATTPDGLVSKPAEGTTHSPGKPDLDQSDGTRVSGVAEPGHTVIITNPATGEEICRATSQADGSFACTPSQPLDHGTELEAIAVDDNGFTSEVAQGTVNVNEVAAPKPRPSDGSVLEGIGVPGATVTVKDSTGAVIGTAVVDSEGHWSTPLAPTQPEGAIVKVTQTVNGKTSMTVPWRIGLPRLVIAHDPVSRAAKQVVDGYNFQPGESIDGTMHSTPIGLGTEVADLDGRVQFEWTIARDTTLGVHNVVLNGPKSGSVEDGFHVAEANDYGQEDPPAEETTPAPPAPTRPPRGALPYTGAGDLTWTLTASALGLVLGWWLLLVAKRRRQEEQEGHQHTS
jgi:LPXTG-motif cell wall-anchored protein